MFLLQIVIIVKKSKGIMECMDHALTEMPGLAWLLMFLVQLLLSWTYQLICPTAGTSTTPRSFITPI